MTARETLKVDPWVTHDELRHALMRALAGMNELVELSGRGDLIKVRSVLVNALMDLLGEEAKPFDHESA